jgi:hypothetical protein
MERLLEKKNIVVRALVVLACLALVAAGTGCSLLSEAWREARAERLKIEKGAVLECCGGKLKVEVPEQFLMAETNKPLQGGVSLSPIYSFGYSKTYVIQPVSAGDSTNGSIFGGKKSLEQHVAKYWRPEFASLIKISRSETNLWRGKLCYYHEWLIPGDIRQARLFFFKLKNSWEIHRPHILVVGRLVPVDSGFCWFHMISESEDFEPVPQKWTDSRLVEKFADFMDGVSVMP